MRDRPRHRSDLQIAVPSSGMTDRLERIFQPERLDVDDLAEAIRSLLGNHTAREDSSVHRPDRHLLSTLERGTHVVEATGAH